MSRRSLSAQSQRPSLARASFARKAGRWLSSLNRFSPPSTVAASGKGPSLMGDGVPQRLNRSQIPQLARGQGLELAARQAVDGLYAGRHRSPRVGSSLDFADHRPYQDGDELRSIDWKAYARTDRLMVRRWHDDRQLPIALLLDTSGSMAYGAPAKGEIARMTAAILGLLAFDQGDKVRVFLSGKVARVEPTMPEQLCEALCSVADVGDAAAAHLLDLATERLAQRHVVILLSDLLDDPATLITAAAALTARGHELACLQILDRSEITLPRQWGPTRFTDPEGHTSALEGDANDLADAYGDALAAHQERLANACAGLHADHRLLPTDENLSDTLGAWLAGRMLSRRGAGR